MSDAVELVAEAIHNEWQGTGRGPAHRTWAETCEKLPGQAESFRRYARVALRAPEAATSPVGGLLGNLCEVIETGLGDGLSPDEIVGNIEVAISSHRVLNGAPCTREPGAPLPSDETRPAVDKVRTMLAMGINIQGNGAVINGIVTGILEGMLAHVDELEADLKCAIAVGQMAAKQGQQSAAMTSKALVDIATERQRQISVEGWSPQHDDEHEGGQIAAAAGVYALVASDRHNNIAQQYWPWDFQWWKPCDARRNLVKAGALIAAEIDRLDRIDALARNDRNHEAG